MEASESRGAVQISRESITRQEGERLGATVTDAHDGGWLLHERTRHQGVACHCNNGQGPSRDHGSQRGDTRHASHMKVCMPVHDV